MIIESFRTGKTEALVRYAIELVKRGDDVLIVSENELLAQQIFQQMNRCITDRKLFARVHVLKPSGSNPPPSGYLA